MTSRLREAKVAVLSGGCSGEREVSLESGRAVLSALGAAEICGELCSVEILADGRWSFDGASHAPAEALARLGDVDLFFLALHGAEGEDGTVQGFLRLAGKCHTGSGVAASAVCMDKVFARELVSTIGVSVARATVIRRTMDHERRADVVREASAWGEGGVSVKPRHGGSSVATALVQGERSIAGAVDAVLEVGDEALVEQVVVGVEVTAGVLGNAGEQLQSLPLVEIRPKPGRFFDYEEKYSQGGALELCPPESLDSEQLEAVAELGRRIHDHLRLAGYSRSDFILGSEGLVFLETNTLPGLSGRSLFPQAAAAAGIDFPALCTRIAEAALRVPSRGPS